MVLDIYEKYLKERKWLIAMQVQAVGTLRPKEAIEYLCRFSQIESVLFGASLKGHIEKTKNIIEHYLKSHRQLACLYKVIQYHIVRKK